MPQTGYTPIQIYSSSTPTNAPSAGNLTNDTKGSELAINIADKNLFFKDSSNVVNTVPIRQSGTSSNGWLSSTDWNTFNNKQPAGAYLTSVTADAPLSGAGTSASHLVIAQATTSTSGYLSSTDWNTFNNKQPAGTYVTSVTGTAPVVSSGGTTPAISMAAATTSVNGYLTSADWNTFNGKQAALVSGTNIKTVSGTSLLGSGDLGTIGTGYGGTGLTSFTQYGVMYASSTSALASTSYLTFNPTDRFSVVSSNSGNTISLAVGGAGDTIQFVNGTNTWSAGSSSPGIENAGDYYSICRLPNGGSWAEFARFLNTGGFRVVNTIGVGNATPSTSGAGITFPATQSASSDANTLDDYEEGTFTPYLNADSGGQIPGATTSSGKYVKVGSVVTITGSVTWSSFSVGYGGAARIYGFPFNPADNGTVPKGYNSYATASYDSYQLTTSGRLDPSIGGSAGIVNISNFTSGGTMYFNFSYRV